MLRHAVLFLAAEPPGAPDMGWLTALAGRLMLVIQLGVTAVFALVLAGDVGKAIAGGQSARAAAKMAFVERVGWFIALWVVGFVVTIALWVVGRGS